MSYTFDLGLALNKSLQLNSDPQKTVTAESAVKSLLKGDCEQCCDISDSLIGGKPHLVGLSKVAFSQHRHMILDPDTIWLTIERGLAIHITKNSEELRDKFVNFKGKKFLKIRRDNFIKGGKNDWEGCFDEFSEKIGEHIGEKKDLIVGKFSTTQTLQRVASEIILMDAMSKYFDYGMQTLCSIPSVTLEGEVSDWESIRDKVSQFKEFGLDWWTDHMIPVLDQLVETSKGNADLDWWKSWFKLGGGSGGPYVSGHIQKLYPYLSVHRDEAFEKNDFQDRPGMGGLGMGLFPQGISKVPFVWEYYDTKYPMEFIGGIIGVQQNQKGAVKCAFGWAVRDSSVPLSQYAIENMVEDMVIHSTDGDVGKLKRADVISYPGGSRILSDVRIEWEKKGSVEHRSWDFGKLFVKEASTGTNNLYKPEEDD